MPRYRFVNLHCPPGPDSSLKGLNNRGDLVGWIGDSQDPGAEWPCLWDKDAGLRPRLRKGGLSLYRINDDGESIGRYAPLVLDRQGNTLVDLALVLGRRIGLQDINHAHVVAGGVLAPGPSVIALGLGPQALVYDLMTSQATWINPLPGRQTALANAVNPAGLVVGISDDHAFRYFSRPGARQGQMDDLGAGYLSDLNENGIAVGWQRDRAGHEQPIWMDCTETHPHAHLLNLPPGCTNGWATAINADRTIVGYYDSFPVNDYTAFVSCYQRGGQGEARDLNTLVDTPEWRLLSAWDINETGDIVGDAERQIPPGNERTGGGTGCLLENLAQRNRMGRAERSPNPLGIRLVVPRTASVAATCWPALSPQWRLGRSRLPAALPHPTATRPAGEPRPRGRWAAPQVKLGHRRSRVRT
jgi:hypothetical protein